MRRRSLRTVPGAARANGAAPAAWTAGTFPPVAYAERYYGGTGDPWAPQDMITSGATDPGWVCRARAGDTLVLRDPVPPPPAPAAPVSVSVPVRRRRRPLRWLARAVFRLTVLAALLGAADALSLVRLPVDPADVRIEELRPWLEEARARAQDLLDRLQEQ